ncbi:MAG: TonB-dependent receptor [Acidobacteriia bacterium]|nr:TonB-dependent receptor [Terriglobia bacterium]
MNLRLAMVVCLVLTAGSVQAKDNAPDQQDLSNLDLEQLMQIKVEAASLHEQSLEDAPASVTVITQDEIRRYGYRTLGEALSYVRGMFVTYDHTYHFLGVRGLSTPGDYGTHFLVMVNGHNIADNILSQTTYFGQDFPVDMTLVKRIEIIRGPSSSLYGSDGMFATINVVTIAPEEFGGTQVRAEAGTFGEKKLQAASSIPLGHGATLLLSGALFNDAGVHSMYIPAEDSPATNFGRAIDMDGEKGYHLFANLTWRDWSVLAVFDARPKIQPVSWGPTVFNDRGSRAIDSRNFIDATYTHNFDESRSLQWRMYYDNYRFLGIFRSQTPDDIADNRDFFYGDWAGTQLSYRFSVPHFGSLTVGGEGRFDLRTLQKAVYDQADQGPSLSIDKRDRYLGIFAQDEWDLTRAWKLDLGARLDHSAYRNSSVSPRAALIYQPSTRVSYKFLYGRAFRNPTAFELFYNDPTVATLANPSARPEKETTFEFVVERKLTRRLNALLSAYRYDVRDLLVGEYTAGGEFQYRNAGRDRSSGLEMELNGHPFPWLEMVASLAVQRAVNTDHNYPLANSPGQIGKLRLSVPLFTHRLSLASGSQYLGSRQTLDGATLPSLFLTDLTVNTSRLTSNLDFQAGVRNLAGIKYADPIALYDAVETLPVPGRSIFIALTWHSSN